MRLLNIAIYQNAGVGVTLILSFGLSLLFANYLPKEVFGAYQYLLSLGSILSALTMTGMNYALTRAVARGLDGTLVSSIRAQMRWNSMSLIVGLVAAGYYFVAGDTLIATGALIAAGFVPLTATFNTYYAYLNGKKAYKEIFVSGLILNAAYYPLMVIGILYTPHALALFGINMVAVAVSTYYVYRRALAVLPPTGGVDDGAVAYGQKISLSHIPSLIAAQLDSILVFHFLGAAPLALYALIKLVPEKGAGLFKFVLVAALPRFAEHSEEAVRDGLMRKVILMLIASGIAASAAAALMPFVFHTLFPAYATIEAIYYAQIYATTIVMSVGFIPLAALINEGSKNLYINNTVAPTLLLITQSVGMMWYGMLGLIVGRLIGQLASVLISLTLVLFFGSNKEVPQGNA